MLFGSPWWVWLYAMLIAGVGLGGVRDDLHEGRSFANTFVGFLPTVLLLSFVLAYWDSRAAAGLGRAVWLLFSVAVVWEGTAAVRDLRKVRTDPTFAACGNLAFKLAGVALYVAVVTPALVWGAIACVRAW